ncbi:MAG: hypothetical protein A2X94_05755 [Bdellovibrionales bacterium GWB1_55_8]|nr:MAG: hypothetical protein A2X94_05755 [Bdellovibrionales bacterium GWB1_55_8]
MVFSGGGFQSAMFLGMLDAAEELGQKPDVVIGACGGSIAAVIANSIGDRHERRAFIESEEYFDLLRSASFNEDTGVLQALGKVIRMRERKYTNTLPAIFSGYLMNVPVDLTSPKLSQGFSTDGIRAMIISALVKFGPEDVGRRRGSRKVFKEVIFTDKETAAELQGFESPIAKMFPKSAVETGVDVLTSESLMAAARASISDPYYMNPASIGNDRFVTGAIDMYPIEAAKLISDEVTMGFAGDFDTLVEVPAIKSTFRFDSNKRLRYVHDQYAERWVDISNTGKALYATSGFNPKVSISGLKWGIPADHETFLRKVREQFAFGRARALEGFARTTLNDKSHIREMNPKNSSRGLRTMYGR